MELIYYPHPVLKRRALPVAAVNDEVRERARAMLSAMYRERGVGLAAPQVNWSARLFVTNTSGEADPGAERIYINPAIRSAAGESEEEEGCLSIPGIRGKVKRSERVVIEALNLEGRPFEEDLTGLEARVFQHELDHLDGILFITRLSLSERIMARKVLKQLEKEYKQGSRAER